MYPGTIPIGQMTETQIWSSYIRYIGAGAVTAAGIIMLVRTLPTIVSSFKSTFGQLKNSKLVGALKVERTARDLPLPVIGGGAVLVVGFLWALLAFHINPKASGNLISAFLMVFFGFFFATVSARIVGLIGSSSNPVSGMTIATLMGTCLIFCWWDGRAACIPSSP